jgi:hypothetical protein
MQNNLLRYLVVILILVSGINGYAQEIKVTSISGIVTDTIFKPIEFATIQLFSNDDSSMVYGAITGIDGIYSIKNVVLGKYTLKAGSINYDVYTKDIELNNARRNTALGLIRLKESTYQIDDITVEGARTGITDRVDKMVFVPDSMTLRTAKTGVDILNKIPEVRYNKKNETISVLGNTNVLVLINGIDNDRSIISINPEDIERIELLTHPSVKYRSDVASVINIVLKGHKQKGITFGGNLYYCLDKKNHTGNFQLDYNVGKWRFFAFYAGTFQQVKSTDSTFRSNYQADYLNEYQSYSLSDNIVDFHRNSFQYGFDYDINTKNFFSFTSKIITWDQESSRNMNMFLSANQTPTEQSAITSFYNSYKNHQNYSLYYLHKFKNDNEQLTINTNYYNLNDNSSHSIIDSSILFPSYLVLNNLRVTEGSYSQGSLNGKIDYTKPFSERTTFETGYQFYNRKIQNYIKSTDTEDNTIVYSDYRNSIYASGTYNLEKLSFQAGTRVENFNIKVNDTTNNQTKFLPYGAIYYKINPTNSLKFTYRIGLEYPVYSYLNPYKYYSSDSLTYFTGNPYLKPEQKQIFNLKYAYKKKNTHFSLDLSYNYLDELISLSAKLKDNVLGYNYENVGKAKRYESVVSYSSIFFDWVEFEMLLRGGYTDFITKKSHNGYSYAAECGLYLPLVWGFDLEIYGVLKERVIDYNGFFEYGGYIEEILLSKDITNNLFIGFAVWQPFFNLKDTDKQWGADFTEINKYTEISSTSYLLNLTYYFKTGTKSNKRENESLMENAEGKGKHIK